MAYCDITFLENLDHVEGNWIDGCVVLEALPKGICLIDIIGLFDKVEQRSH